MLSCVVCGAGLAADAAQYANTWERSRKKFPCCAGCVARFDPDVHWLPARLPERASTVEQARMVKVFGKRLGDGDKPRVLVREMLLAGLDPAELRRNVEITAGNAEIAQARADRRSMVGLFGWLFAGRGKLAEARDQRRPRDFAEALEDLDAWEAAVAKR